MPVPNRITTDAAELPDRFVSRDVAATFLGLSPRTLATWASAGCGPVFSKLSGGRSGCVRYRLSELERFASDPQAYTPRPVAAFNVPGRKAGRLSVARPRKRKARS
jgi:hypothetical protein